MCYFEPTNQVAEESWRFYQENILHVQRQWKFSESTQSPWCCQSRQRWNWVLAFPVQRIEEGGKAASLEVGGDIAFIRVRPRHPAMAARWAGRSLLLAGR